MRLLNFFTLLLCFHLPAFAEVTHIDNQELRDLQQCDVPLFDVRTAPEWKQTGLIQDSHPLTFFDQKGRYDVDKWLAEFSKVVTDKDQPFILICRSGNRTSHITRFLHERYGYNKVYNVKRGIRHWIKEGQPVVAIDEIKAIK